MAIDKFTTQPYPNAVVDKINEIIDNLGTIDNKLSTISNNFNGTNAKTTLKLAIIDLGKVAITTLADKDDGVYLWVGTINSVGDGVTKWRISKSGGVYEAIYLGDPHIYFISTNASQWYSPYGSWHA